MKYFVVSDIHGFFKEFKHALDLAKYDVNNDNHMLVVCGDIFDRGNEAIEVYQFLKSIPKEKRILIRGNHEYLLRDLVERGFPASFDFSNGTVDTLIQLSNDAKEIANETSHPLVKEILDWFSSSEWVNYYELDKYIFVHAFIPLYNHAYCHYYSANPYTDLSYITKWRIINDTRIIEGATWGCPWKCYRAGLFSEEAKKGKILVCGHWHASDFYYYLGGADINEKPNYNIYRGQNIIAIDACTALSHQVNVLIINEDNNPYTIINGKEAYLDIYKDSL